MLCMARACGDQPLERIAVSAERGLIYVANPSLSDAVKGGEDVGVGFPPDTVFVHEPELLARLQHAFSAGDHDTLVRLWAEAKPLPESEVRHAP